MLLLSSKFLSTFDLMYFHQYDLNLLYVLQSLLSQQSHQQKHNLRRKSPSLPCKPRNLRLKVAKNLKMKLLLTQSPQQQLKIQAIKKRPRRQNHRQYFIETHICYSSLLLIYRSVIVKKSVMAEV